MFCLKYVHLFSFITSVKSTIEFNLKPQQHPLPKYVRTFVNPVTEVKMPWNSRKTRMIMRGYGFVNIWSFNFLNFNLSINILM